MTNCTVNSCCCFSLRTGCLIIGWLGVVGSFLQIFGKQYENSYEGPVQGVIGILIYASSLYGIYSQRPAWVLGAIIASAIKSTIIVFSGIILIAAFAAATDNHQNDNGDRSTFIGILATTYAFAIALSIYFTMVLYSFYKQLKQKGVNPCLHNSLKEISI